RPLVNALARYLVGDQVADWDGIPREPFWERAIATAWPKLVAFREKLIPLPLVPPLAWTIDEAARQYILFYLTKGQGTHIEIPETNRPT
ncbi:oxygenase MpaB family protein, partial [Nocardia sp. NPDC003354]